MNWGRGRNFWKDENLLIGVYKIRGPWIFEERTVVLFQHCGFS